ncbi:hypothetical protein Tco_1411169 [Tanacetum coccineum]
MLMVEDNVGNQFRPNAMQNVGNQVVLNASQNPGVQNVGNQNGLSVVSEIVNQHGDGNVVTAPAEGNGNGINDCSKEKQGIQLTSEEFDFIAARCLSAEVHHYENCYNNDIFNMFTQEEKYTELLDPIPEPHQVQQNDSNVISEVSSVEQFGGTVEQHPVTVEETRAYFESLYNNLATEVEKVNLVNRKMKETNAELTTELASPVYQEQCLTKKINALHLSSGKQITTLNEEISNLSKQLSTEKLTVSSLLEEKKKLKSDFKIREDKLLDKHIQLEK